MIHLVIGPVGAGKSTFARQLSEEQRAVRLTLDEWMAVLFGADERPVEGRIHWYIERTERCQELIWRQTKQLLEVGTPVVLEIGLIQREARARFYGKLDEMAYRHVVYVLDAEREVRRERVLRRNRERGATFSMEVPEEFFDLASDRWEPPDELEQADREMRMMHT